MGNPNNKKEGNLHTGKCALCSRHGKLSFEHIPPQCAFNNKPIFVQTHEHLVDESSYLFGKKKKSQRGFGKQTLCESCNNNTGAWYVKDFCNFIKQGMDILINNKNPYVVSGSYSIKPQNVIKQILLMFLAADSLGVIRDLPGVSEYLLNKENAAFPDKVNLYIYSNSSPKKRMLGYCIVYDAGRICKWSEINYRPFGYFFTYDSPPPNEFMVKITDFSKIPYDKECDIQLNTAYLIVNDVLIGHYDEI